MMQPGDWLVPDWPAPRGVNAVFTTRAGGMSKAPWDSMNLGDHVGDAAADVHHNRAQLADVLGARPVFLRQVHGVETAVLAGWEPDGLAADACLTTQSRVACTIMVADCLPVLFCTRDGSAVAGAHAGWRGLAGSAGKDGVLEAAAQALGRRASAGPADLMAWLGPCIGPTAFEVGEDVKKAFEAVMPASADLFVQQASAPASKYLADLAGLARLRLAALGVTQVFGNDGSAPWCTVSNPSRFFSHRRDAGSGPFANGLGTTGRMAACIWRD